MAVPFPRWVSSPKPGRLAAGSRSLGLAVLLGIASLITTAAGPPKGYVETDLVVNKLVNGVPTLTDGNGIVHIAKFFDPNLANPWGVAESSGSPFWVSDNHTGLSTLYNTPGQPQGLVVSIPAPGDPLGASGAPTGIVFNPTLTQATPAFQITGVAADGVTPVTAPAIFIFDTEDGTILGWNPGVFPATTPPTVSAPPSTHAIIAVDNSAVPDADNHAIYKGLAVATDATGHTLLYATNFRAGTVETYDASFGPGPLPTTAFTDSKLGKGYAPFNVVPIAIGNVTELFVTYAIQNEEKEDDVAGQGHGIVDTFDLSGHMLARFAQHGQLDSPWGVTLAKAGFGELGGTLWIGNFGNGHINAFDPLTGQFLGKIRGRDNKAIVIEGLWTLMFGNGGNGGDPNTLYFTAGPNDEADGIFGSILPE